MTGVVVALVIVVVALGVGAVLRARRPASAPTQVRHTVPSQLDRRDFAPGVPWVVVVFSSATCDACADVVRKAQVLSSGEVAVVEAEYTARRDLHDKYSVTAVPITVIADGEGVVRRGFAGPVTATDLWAAVAEARSPGASPSVGECGGAVGG